MPRILGLVRELLSRMQRWARARSEDRIPDLVTDADGKHLSLWKIHGELYDLSTYDDHPGGRFVLDLVRGTDCTVAFETYHFHTDAHLRKLDRFAARRCEAVWERRRRPGAEFWDDVRTAVGDELYRLTGGRSPGMSLGRASRLAALWLCVVLPCWLAWWSYGGCAWGVLLAATSWLWSTNVSHDASHFAIVKGRTSLVRRALNDVLVLTAWPLVCNSGHWYMQHTVFHHMYTNDTMDPDTQLPVRVSGRQSEHLSVFGALPTALQFLLVCPTLCLSRPLRDMWAAIFPRSSRFPTAGDRRAQFVLYELVELAAYLSFWAFVIDARGLARAVVPIVTSSVIFNSITQVSHIQREAFAEASSDKERHWAVAQVRSTVDYSRESRAAAFLTGGVNNQAIHHLFPSVCSEYYPRIVRAYLEAAERHGVRVNTASSFADALREHLAYLSEING